ncbi:MAG: ADOP family duplicated permease [Terriglobales bacterium]
MRHHLHLREREGGEPRAARLRVGPPERLGAQVHGQDVIAWLESCVQDVRHSGRILRRSPALTCVIVASLAIGIGANAAIFSLLNAVLLKTLPVPQPQQIVLLGQSDGNDSLAEISYPVVQQLASVGRGAGVLVGAASSTVHVPLGPAASSRTEVGVQLVTGGYFAGLGVQPRLGRFINASDNRALGVSPVAVISYGFWQSHWGGDLDAIGRTLRIDVHTLTVVGVAPPGFGGLNPASPADLWVPVMMQPVLAIHGNNMDVGGKREKPWPPQEQIAWLDAFARFPSPSLQGRLEPQWNAVLHQSWKRILTAGASWHLTLAAGARGSSRLRGQYGAPLRILLGLAALMLLIAIANVATLLLARSVRRRREIAIRMAVGVSRPRLARQLITEGLFLAVISAVAAAGLAYWMSGFLVRLAGAGNGVPFRPDLNWRVWALLAIISLVTGMVLGVLPAWQVQRGSPAEALKSEGGPAAGGKRVPLGRWLIVAQVALALLLVAAAGLFARNLAGMFHVNLGFQPEHLLGAELTLRGPQLPRGTAIALQQELLARAHALPGVTAAALVLNGLEAGGEETSGIAFPGQTATARRPESREDTVSRGFFATVGMPRLRGRDFAASDTANSPAVVIVNQAFVHAYYSGRNPLGQTFGYGSSQEGQFRIIGVVADARVDDPHAPAVPMFFHLAEQTDNLPLRVVVRSAGAPQALAAALRHALKGVDPRLTVSGVSTMNERLGRLLSRDRLIAQLSGGFGLLALLLACLGVYGVMAYAVAARMGEFGLRMALGATRGAVLGMVLGETVRLLAIGASAGLGLTLLAARWVHPLLPGVGASDPATLIAAIGVMLGVPLLAALLPAWRAARADPAGALRA